ncbi:MAG: glycosyltransferase, partial [Armatimonadetes bacterium]|nr:glycosyltransferase [Armatimonadota bacterium]
ISIFKDRLNLNKGLPVLLVMGGGLGIGPVEKIMRLVKNINLALHIVIIAGKNNKLKKKLEDLADKIESLCEIKILGYVENIHEYMRSADLLITKAGGLTIAEALCAELPMLIVKPIPGQELRNTKFLLTKRVALRANKENKLTKLVEELILHPERLKKMREKTKILARPDAAEKIAHLAVHIINKRKIEKRQISG